MICIVEKEFWYERQVSRRQGNVKIKDKGITMSEMMNE